MSDKLRWGIIATGSIARKFATGLRSVDGAELVAVGSRSREKADEFGDEFDIPRRHAGYEALVGDGDVDAVYVATPHNLHVENTILALEAGKAVLCEKPFAINAEQARMAVHVARENNLFLMEAMWTRFFPIMYRLRELLVGGVLGEIRMVTADFGFRAEVDPDRRLFNPALGGGGLLDVGVYPVSFMSMVLGRPSRITGMAEIGATGVDEQAAVVFGYDGGQLGALTTGIRTSTPQEATVIGTEGRIRIHSPWWQPQRMTIRRPDAGDEEIHLPVQGNGFNYEADHVARCIARGKTESDVMGLDETIAVMETMDEIRAQWGLKYPME